MTSPSVCSRHDQFFDGPRFVRSSEHDDELKRPFPN